MDDYLDGYVFCPRQSHLIPRTFCAICDAENCPDGQNEAEKPDSANSQVPSEAPNDEEDAAARWSDRVKKIYCRKSRGKIRLRRCFLGIPVKFAIMDGPISCRYPKCGGKECAEINWPVNGASCV
jgi:hypothetical protein